MRLLVKTLLMEIILRLKVTMNQVKTKKLFWGYFCRFVTSALTLRPRNTHSYVFGALSGFCNFLKPFQWVLEARSKLTLFYTKFWVTRARFLSSTCTSLLLCSKPVQWNYRHFFLRFQTEERVLRVKINVFHATEYNLNPVRNNSTRSFALSLIWF